jgi:hypothetical protein
MAAMASNSSTAKESLLLSHAEATDEWGGWCTVESEPVPILEERTLNFRPYSINYFGILEFQQLKYTKYILWTWNPLPI